MTFAAATDGIALLTLRKRPWALAVLYVGVSLALEAGCMIFGGLRVPQDNVLLAPIVLTIPPLLAGVLANRLLAAGPRGATPARPGGAPGQPS